jgi:hypothetical protein
MDTAQDHIESGAWVGRQQAFAVIAGKCSAAQAAALQEIKQSRVYESLGLTWQEYCPRFAGMTREGTDLLSPPIRRVRRILVAKVPAPGPSVGFQAT